MKQHEATEQAYKNGYEKGKADALKDSDMVKVTRCKDCKRREVDCFGRTVCVRNGQMTEIKDTDFCSYGERREG